MIIDVCSVVEYYAVVRVTSDYDQLSLLSICAVNHPFPIKRVAYRGICFLARRTPMQKPTKSFTPNHVLNFVFPPENKLALLVEDPLACLIHWVVNRRII